MIRNTFGALVFFVLILSCSISDGNKFKAKSKAFGVMNEIVVVSDDDLWDGIVGDTIIHFFESIFPLTPRPEPLFDLRHYQLEDLEKEPLKKELRTYLIVADLSDENSVVTQLVRDDLGEEKYARALVDDSFHTSVGQSKWAEGQILIYIFGKSADELCKVITDNFDGISSRINKHDEEQLRQSTYARGENLGLSAKLRNLYNLEIKIPADYILVKDEVQDKLIWLRKDYKDGTIGLVFREYEYKSVDQLSKEFAKKNFNEFGSANVSSPEANSYLVINDIDLPILEFERQLDGIYVKEFRGIWEMENDFMGGPFISYLLVAGESGKIVQVDCFVFAEGKKKRNVMQQVDLIVKKAKKIN